MDFQFSLPVSLENGGGEVTMVRLVASPKRVVFLLGMSTWTLHREQKTHNLIFSSAIPKLFLILVYIPLIIDSKDEGFQLPIEELYTDILKFGKQLALLINHNTVWKDYYLDYKGLKTVCI